MVFGDTELSNFTLYFITNIYIKNTYIYRIHVSLIIRVVMNIYVLFYF